MDMREVKGKMQIFIHGSKNEGYSLLRSLIAICVILLCLTSVVGILFNANKESSKINIDVNLLINKANNTVYENL